MTAATQNGVERISRVQNFQNRTAVLHTRKGSRWNRFQRFQ